MFHEAGKCLVNMPLMLIQPLWTFIVLIVFLALWLIILAFIATMGTSRDGVMNEIVLGPGCVCGTVVALRTAGQPVD